MRHVKRVFLVAVSMALFVVVAGNDNVTCIPAPPEEPVCVAPADCEGLPHVLCVGEWTCQEGLCAWICEPEPPPPPPESECFADDECPSAHECVLEEWCPPCVDEVPGCEMPCYAIGQCLPIESECLADGDCPPGHVCVLESYCPPCVDAVPPCLAPCWAAGQCELDDDPPPPPGCCESDDDCYNGTVCVYDKCEPAPAPGHCWDESDCLPGQTCWGVITCGCGLQCFAAPEPGICQGPVGEGCYEDEDCAFNEKCEITNECCSPPGCVPGQPCPDVCVPCGECVQLESECAADNDCPPGEVCEWVSYCPDCVYADPPCKAPCWAVGQCVEPADECKIIEPWAYGMCEMLMGAGWDGEKCTYISGCGCDDCSGIFNTMDECIAACVGL